MDVHHNLPKKPTSFSSDFALALSIASVFTFVIFVFMLVFIAV